MKHPPLSLHYDSRFVLTIPTRIQKPQPPHHTNTHTHTKIHKHRHFSLSPSLSVSFTLSNSNFNNHHEPPQPNTVPCPPSGRSCRVEHHRDAPTNSSSNHDTIHDAINNTINNTINGPVHLSIVPSTVRQTIRDSGRGHSHILTTGRSLVFDETQRWQHHSHQDVHAGTIHPVRPPMDPSQILDRSLCGRLDTCVAPIRNVLEQNPRTIGSPSASQG